MVVKKSDTLRRMLPSFRKTAVPPRYVEIETTNTASKEIINVTRIVNLSVIFTTSKGPEKHHEHWI